MDEMFSLQIILTLVYYNVSFIKSFLNEENLANKM